MFSDKGSSRHIRNIAAGTETRHGGTTFMTRKSLYIITITALAFLTAVFESFAGGPADIRKDANYIWSEGTGNSTSAADSVAVDALAVRLASVVRLPYAKDMNEAIMRTYTDDIRKVSEFSVVSNRRETSVMRYILRSSIDEVFANRRRRISEMKDIAQKAESKAQIDVALRYWSWVSVLAKSVPNADAALIAEAKAKRLGILSGLDVKFDCRNVVNKQVVELTFTYKGAPVRNVDYRFYNGTSWSGIMSAKDGKGFIEVSPSSRLSDYRIMYESDPAHLQHIYREVKAVEIALGKTAPSTKASVKQKIEKTYASSAQPASSPAAVIDSSEFVRIQKIDLEELKKKVLDVMSSKKFQSKEDSIEISLSPVLFDSTYRAAISKVCDAVNSNDFSAVKTLFTEEGYEVFTRLIAYGDVSVLDYDRLAFYALGNEVWGRSVPMAFSFKGNTRRFVEDVVFTFNDKALISNLSFSLGSTASKDITSHENWPEEARLILVNFLEVYKTAYALKRVDYIRSIFDDDALIITGRVLKNAGGFNEFGGNQYVMLTRQNKETYIRNLAKVFAANEYINIQFSDCEVMKLGNSGQLYGIKIRQEYFSASYSDTGYLFILVDLTDFKNPVIHVRTWQDAPDKDFGVIGPYHF